MVKYFSVDWLAQSHHDTADSEDDATAAANRPHVPCMVPPAPPTFGKSCLQPKPSKPTDPKEVGEEQGSCPSSPDSKSSDYSSGEDSKAESPQEGSSGEKVQREKQRRVRTKFSSEQLAKLEKIFGKHKYLDVVRRVKTAQKLDLTETQVRTWFQNRRMKMKREMRDHTGTPIPANTFQHMVPLQYCALAPPQAPQYPVFDPAFYYPYHHMAPQPQMPPHLMAHPPNYFTGLLSEN